MSLPYAPTKVKLIDEQGYLSREWHAYFDQLWNRVGGSNAQTNLQLQQTTVQIQETINNIGLGGPTPYFIDDNQASDDGGVIPGPQGPAGLNGSTGPAGPAGFGVDGSDGDDGYPIPGPMGPQGPQGLTGPAGSGTLVIFQSEDGQDGDAGMPGVAGPAGAAGAPGAVGPAVYLEAPEADEPMVIPGPAGATGATGSTGLTGAVGPTGPAVYLEADAAEPDFFLIPGPAGATGPQGPSGTGGASTVIPGMDGDAGEDGMQGFPGLPGANGATGAQGPIGPAVYLEAEVVEPDMFLVPGPAGAAGISASGLLGVAGGLTALTTIAATVTATTGGITLASQTAAAGSVWRVRAMGTFVAVSSATARNALITPVWGATALPALTVGAVLVSTAQTTNFECEFILTASSTTAIWATGFALNRVASATALALAGLTPASTTVTAGAQTIDLRFSMSAAVAGDSWSIQQVTIERIK